MEDEELAFYPTHTHPHTPHALTSLSQIKNFGLKYSIFALYHIIIAHS